jgi:hydroxypyruvate isomerase
VAWWCFVPALMTPAEFVHATAEIGFDAVELAPREYFALIRDHGLAIATMGGHGPLEVGLNRLANHDQIAEAIESNLTLAKQWEIPNLICFSGNRNGLDDRSGIENTVIGLRRVAPGAEKAGVTLVLEGLNSRVDHPDYQYDRTSWGVAVVEQVNSPRVKLLYDIYHMQIMEGDPIRTIQHMHPLIGHYHTAGNPGRHDLDEQQELNYPAILREISKTGFSGYVGHEFVPKGDPVAALRAAYELGRAVK